MTPSPLAWGGGWWNEGHQQRGIGGVLALGQVGAQMWVIGAVGVHLLVCELSVNCS
jgi:hypothetical protein